MGSRRGRAEDDRQRPLGRRTSRSASTRRSRSRPRRSTGSHDGRVAQPGHGRRGDGAAHRLDRDVMSGIAGGADVILVPEQPSPSRTRAAAASSATRAGKDFSIVVVSEGTSPYESGERRLSRRGALDDSSVTSSRRRRRCGAPGDRAGTGFETRVTVLGHRPARRHAHGVRPGAGDAVRRSGGRPRRGRALRHDGGAARRLDRRRAARGGDRASLKGCRPSWYDVAERSSASRKSRSSASVGA